MVQGEGARIRLGWPELGDAELAEVAEALESGMLTMGPKVEAFEAEIARACEVEHALVVTSGTAALHLAVQAFGLAPGDEVLVPAYTFPATANVVALSGLTPVLVDVDPETMNIDPAQIEVGARTRLVLGVHLFGRPMRLHELPDVPLLEDAAGALGARYRGRACGGLGVAGCLSFHPRKIVTTGEGGAITTSDDAFAAEVRTTRNHGWRSLVPPDMPAAGLNYRLSDILCAVGIPQMRRLDELLAARTRIADGYTERLAHLDVLLPHADDGDVHGWQAYVLQVDDRDRVLAELRAQGIEAQIGTYALHLLGAYRDQGSFPGATRVFERALALPFHTRLTDSELDRVAEALDKLVSHH
ncbi:MAG TPA: DegT/DnrJ/EryC1/StrS family aminotransferase [Gaiellaceae bacterium]|nr:DegT/DnrJ/EryC1/StrS family aminotransferase [Gaiellaceae bacterium]